MSEQLLTETEASRRILVSIAYVRRWRLEPCAVLSSESRGLPSGATAGAPGRPYCESRRTWACREAQWE
jgi:hypothetical protein